MASIAARVPKGRLMRLLDIAGKLRSALDPRVIDLVARTPYEGTGNRDSPFTSSLSTMASAISFMGLRFCRLCRCNAR
jgi:hypothetical protein